MAVTITQDEAKLFESNGFSYDDVNNTVKHYRQEGLSDDAIQQKINSRIVQFRNALPKENEHALNNSLKKLPKDDPYVQTQEYQTEQLANLLFTPDELKAMEQQGKMGWVEYRSRGFVGWSDIMPFVGTIKQGYQAGKTLSLAKKMEKGEELSEADKTYMKNYLRNYVEIQKRGMTWGATGANMAVQAPAFMTEFCLSGGLGEIAAKGAISGAAKGAGKIATKTATKAAVTKAARFAGEQAVLVPMYATANYNQRKIADGLNVTDKGDMIFNSAQAESDKGRKVFEGLATGEIQVLSELSGGLLGKMAGGAIGVAEKTLGKVATTNVARGISATSAKIYNSLPKNIRIKLEASARLAEKLGKSAAETGEKMKSKGLEFHGIAEEMGEERVEDILMTAFDVDAKEGYSADQWLDAIFPSPQQLLLEAGVFSIVGGTSLATRTVANDLLSKGYSEQETQNIVNSLSEIEKENIANDIIGEVKMNEDITEEEVKQEENAIQMKLFGRVEENVNAAETNIETQAAEEYLENKSEEWENKYRGSKEQRELYATKINELSKAYLDNDKEKSDYLRAFTDIISKRRDDEYIKKQKELLEQLKQNKDLYNTPTIKAQIDALTVLEKFNNKEKQADKSDSKEDKNGQTQLFQEAEQLFAEMQELDKTGKKYNKPTIKINGVERSTTNSEGKAIAKTKEAIEHFYKWFGDSKVVDEENKAIITYHKTRSNKKFKIFETNKPAWFSISSNYANAFAPQNKNGMYEAYLHIENPCFVGDIDGIASDAAIERLSRNSNIDVEKLKEIKEKSRGVNLFNITNTSEFKELLQQRGYDGIEAKEGRGITTYAVFEPNQIKSVDNKGTFDPNNPNIYYDIENEAPKEEPKTLKQVEEVAVQEAEQEEEETGVKGLFSDFKEAFTKFIEPLYTEAVDRFAPIQNTVKRANKKGAELGVEITDKNWNENPYNLARMYSGLANRIWQHFKENTMVRAEDGTQKITGEGFGKIIEDLYTQTKEVEADKETQLKDFEDYLIARRYLLDLKDRDGYEATEEQKLKAIKDMARITEKYGAEIETLEKLADRVYKYNQRTLHLLVDSGNMSQEAYDKIIEQNPHHISYKRVMDETYGTNGLSFARGKFTDAKSPVKKIRGSEREIQSIYKSTLEDTMRIIDIAERNLVAKKVAQLQEYLPEEIKPMKPLMRKTQAKVKVTYDAKMRAQLLEAIKFFGRKFENAKSIKTPQGYALGTYSEEEKLIRKKLGSQDRTLAHEVGHMLDFALGVENKIKDNAAIMKEIRELAKDRFDSVIKLQDGEFITEEGVNSEKYKNYAQSNKEAIANAFDLYTTSRDYVKRVAPKTAAFFENLFKGKYAFLNQIRPSSETATEEILQDVWTRSPEKPSKNAIGYYEDGKLKFVEVEPSLMRSIEDLNPKQMGIIAKVVDKGLKTSSDILRAGATLNPEFILRNPIRDIQEAWFNVDGFSPLIDVPKGLLAVINKNNSKLYKQWQREGGAFNSYLELNEKSINEAIKLYEGKRNLIFKALGFEALEKLSSTLEETTRLGIYNAMLRKGLTPTQAAFMSREGTLDFARGGRFIKQANRYLTFLNAGVQGTDRVLRTLINNPRLALQRGMTMAMAQILLSGYYLYAAPDDDRQEYLEIPEYVKNLSYVFKVGDRWWKIPRPFAPGYLFEAVPEKFMTWLATNKKPEGLELYNFAKDLFTTSSPITDPADFLPPLLKIWLENTANHSFFTDRQIYPDYLNQYEPKERYNKNTTEMAKLLGEKLNMSPALIENAIRGQLGGAGKHFLDIGDYIQKDIKKLLGEEVSEKPYDITNYPVVKGFGVKEPVGNVSQSLNTFYENRKELAEIHNTYNRKKNESYQEAREYKEKHSEELRQYDRIDRAYKDIQKLRKTADKIAKSTQLDGKEKAEQIRTLEARMTDIARRTNEVIEGEK